MGHERNCVMLTNKKLKCVVTILAVFVISFSFFDLLLTGLPFHYGEDTEMLRLALETPWSSLLALSLNPFSPHLYQFSEETYFKTRPFETLVFKMVGSVFGFRAAPLYRVKSLSAALMCAAVFLTLLSVSASWGVAFLGCLFYVTAPSLFASVRYIHDYEVVSQCFLFASLLFFWGLGRDDRSWKKTLLEAAGCLFFGTIAMRTKEPAKALPLILALFLVLQYRWNVFNALKNRKVKIQAVVLLLFTASALFPFLANFPAPKESLSWNPGHIYSFLIQNAHGHETERRVALFTLENTKPGSFVGTFGFLLGWALLAIFLIALLKKRKTVLPPRFPSFLNLSLSWWVASCLGYALIPQVFARELDDRFLVVSLAPGTLVTFLMLHGALERLRVNQGLLRRSSYFVVAVLVLANAQRNLDHIIFARNFHGGWLTAEGKIFREVTENRSPGETMTEEKIDSYLHDKMPQEIFEFIRPQEGWDRKLDPASLDTLKSRLPYLYAATTEREPFEKTRGWKRLAEVNTLTDSPYGRIIKRFKKKNSRTLFLYKWESA